MSGSSLFSLARIRNCSSSLRKKALPRRVVEGERGERIQHAVAAEDAPVERLDSEDRHDVLRGHLVLARRCARGTPWCSFQNCTPSSMRSGVRKCSRYSHQGDDLLDRAVHRLDDLRLRLRGLQQRVHLLAAQAIAADDLVHEGHDLGALEVEAGRRRPLACAGSGAERCDQQQTMRLSTTIR